MAASFQYLKSENPAVAPIGTHAQIYGRSQQDIYNDHVIGWKVGGSPDTLLYPNRPNYREGVDIFPVYTELDPVSRGAATKTLTRIYEFPTGGNFVTVFDVQMTLTITNILTPPGKISVDLRPLVTDPLLFVSAEEGAIVGYMTDRYSSHVASASTALTTNSENVIQNLTPGVANMFTTDGGWVNNKTRFTYRFWMHAFRAGASTTSFLSSEVQPLGGYQPVQGVL